MLSVSGRDPGMARRMFDGDGVLRLGGMMRVMLVMLVISGCRLCQ